MEEATDAFERLATDHAQTKTRRSVRILQIAAAILCTALATKACILLTDPSRKYARAIRRTNVLQSRCDDSLARHRFWYGPLVTARDYCLPHRNERASDPLRASWSCLVVGGWGRDGMCCQNDVAYEMAVLANASQPAVIISTGDNFHPRGLADVSDHRIQTSWRQIYIEAPLAMQARWNMLLGNRDYLGNVQAQLDLTRRLPEWNMPSSYYFETHASGRVFIAFLDTSCMYYRAAELLQFAPSDGLQREYKDRQIADLRNRLGNSNATWKLVVGHHALYSNGLQGREEENMQQLRTTLVPILKQFSVAAYFSGHAQSLEHHFVDGVHSFVSGAGSKVSPLLRKPAWDPLFATARQGFLQIALRYDSDRLVVRFVDLAGSLVHSATLHWYHVNNFTVVPSSLPS